MRVTLAPMAVLLAIGCGADRGPAPESAAALDAPDLLFVVKNEVWGIRLDGTARRSFGIVGDDRRRAGYPRLLPDGRLSVIADDTGLVFPYTSAGDRGYARVQADSLWLGDGACGAIIGGAPRLVWFATRLYTDGTMGALAMRASTDGRTVEGWGYLEGGGLFGAAPDGPDHVLAVRAPLDGDDEIWRLDVTSDALAAETVARIPFPRVARSPGRLADGRVAYVQFDLRDPDHIGELWLVERDGTAHATGIAGVDDALVVGDVVVYEAGGGDGIADLLVTDLIHPPVNLTNTPFVAEHLGWGAPLTSDQP